MRMLPRGDWFPFLVDWCQVQPDFLAHQCPFSSPTCCHPWSLLDLALEGNWLIIKLHACCFFSDYSFNLVLSPPLSSWLHRWSPDSCLTSWALISWLPTVWWVFLHALLSSVVAKATLYPPISTTRPDCSLSIITPGDWHWVSHAVAATFVPLTCAWAWEAVLTLFSRVQASALCCNPSHQVCVLCFCSTPCPAWFLPKCFTSFLWNAGPVLPLLCKLCPQGLKSSGSPSPWIPRLSLVMLS